MIRSHLNVTFHDPFDHFRPRFEEEHQPERFVDFDPLPRQTGPQVAGAPSITPNSEVTLCGSLVPDPHPAESIVEK